MIPDSNGFGFRTIRGWRAFLLLFLGLTVLITACDMQTGDVEPDKPIIRPVKTLVIPHVGGVVRSFPGLVQAVNRVDLAFNVPGQIIALPVREGERVEKGALLARLDPQNYQMAVDAAKADYENALADYRRYKVLVKDGYVSQVAFDKTVARKEVTEAALERARKRLEDTYLRAPFSGVVARRFVEKYTEVKAKQPILSLQDTRRLEVVVDVPEDEVINKDKTLDKMKVVATFSTVPDSEFPVVLKEFSTTADPKTLTYRVSFILPEITKANILPGMTAEVKFIPLAQDGRAVFSLPASALLEADGKRWLWVIDPVTHRVNRREVQAEKTSDGKVLVRSGVEPGELVAIAGVHYLKQGQVVKPVQEIRY